MMPGIAGLKGLASDPFRGLTNQTISRLAAGAPQTATYSVQNDGKVRDHSSNVVETWLESWGSAADYDVRATLQTGTSPSGAALATWLNLGTSRSWSLTDNDTDPEIEVTCQLLIEIGLSGAGSAIDSATVTITANAVL